MMVFFKRLKGSKRRLLITSRELVQLINDLGWTLSKYRPCASLSSEQWMIDMYEAKAQQQGCSEKCIPRSGHYCRLFLRHSRRLTSVTWLTVSQTSSSR
jgi:hypothetical protein